MSFWTLILNLTLKNSNSEKVYPHVQLDNFEFGPILNIFASYVYVMMETGQHEPWMCAGIYFACFGTQVNFGSCQVIDLFVIFEHLQSPAARKLDIFVGGGGGTRLMMTNNTTESPLAPALLIVKIG